MNLIEFYSEIINSFNYVLLVGHHFPHMHRSLHIHIVITEYH